MPNHFTVVALCGRDWSRMEELGIEDYKPVELAENINLCALAMPLPEELNGIVACDPPCRYRNKTTGKFSESCNGEHGTDWERVDLSREERKSLCEKYGYDNWFDWQANNWGTKWGTYEHKVHELGGDCSPILIEFQCAWGPPTPQMMRAIDSYLCQTYCLKNIKWMGHDPYDNNTCEIEVANTLTVANN